MFFTFHFFICLERSRSYLKWQLTAEPLDKIFSSQLYLQKMFARSKLIGNSMLHVIPYFYDSRNQDLHPKNYLLLPMNSYHGIKIHRIIIRNI